MLFVRGKKEKKEGTRDAPRGKDKELESSTETGGVRVASAGP